MTPATRPDRQPRVEMNVAAKMRQMPAVTVDMTDQARMTAHTGVTTMADNALVTAATVTAVLTCIGSGRDERRKADNGRRDESEECRTFEHNQRPFGSM